MREGTMSRKVVQANVRCEPCDCTGRPHVYLCEGEEKFPIPLHSVAGGKHLVEKLLGFSEETVTRLTAEMTANGA
jgi:hypothetical protein